MIFVMEENKKSNRLEQGTQMILFHEQEVYRFDKNLATNMNRIEEIVDAGSGYPGLVRTLLCFFSYEHEHNLLSEGILIPEKFAKEYKINLKDLQAKCSQPYQFTQITQSQRIEMERKEKEDISTGRQGNLSSRLWDSHLENALYVLAHCPISIYATGGFYGSSDSDGFIKGDIPIQVLSAISCHREGRSIYYKYRLNPEFVRNLTSYFLKANRSVVVALRPKALDDLYLKLVNLKSNLLACDPPQYMTTVENTPSFERLCEWAHVPEYTKAMKAYEPRKRKAKLNEALRFMISDARILTEVRWVRGSEDSIAAYTPILVFSQMEARPEFIRNEVKKEFRKMFREEFVRNLADCYRTLAVYRNERGKLSTDMFWDWVYSDQDVNEKRNAYESACMVVYKKIPDNIEEKFRSVLKSLVNRISLKDIDF